MLAVLLGTFAQVNVEYPLRVIQHIMYKPSEIISCRKPSTRDNPPFHEEMKLNLLLTDLSSGLPSRLAPAYT